MLCQIGHYVMSKNLNHFGSKEELNILGLIAEDF